MPADKHGASPVRDHSDSAPARQEPRRGGLAPATRTALRMAADAPPSVTAHLVRPSAAFPAFSFSIRHGWRGLAFEAWRAPSTAGLYAVITNDVRELWHELEQCQPGRESEAPVTPATRDLP